MEYLLPLWQHQAETLERAKELPNFALFFEMGTGKTGTAINLLRYQFYKHKKLLKTLIFCPPVVVNNWKREFKMHSKVGDEVVTLVGEGKKRVAAMRAIMDLDKAKIVVTNYEALMMADLYKLFLQWQPYCMVFDESQKLKSYKAKRTKLATELADGAHYKLILSGTPILNSPMDIWGQYRILDGGQTFDRNFFSFRAKYFYDKNAGMPSQKHFPDWRPHPGIEKHFNELIYRKAARVLKKDCLDLPPLVRKTVQVEMTPVQARAYEAMRKDLVAYFGEEACVASMALTKCLRLQQIVSGFAKTDEDNIVDFGENPRVDALEETLEMIGPDSKIIVWAVFKENYRVIEALLDKMEIKYSRLYGGMTDKQRQEGIDAFQGDKVTRVMLANQQAGGVGCNLVSASYSIFYSRNFSLEADMQAEARNYRAGSEQFDKITRIDIVTPGTIDELILEALARKENLANSILSLRGKL